MKNLLLILVILGFVLGCGSSSGNNSSAPTNSRESTPTQAAQGNGTTASEAVAVITVSARDLVKAYKENELAADEKYQGKKLSVSGKVSNIATVLCTIQVDLEGRDFVTVKCVFPDERKSDVAKLKTGQTATLLGTGDGMTASLYVGINDCSVK